MLRISLGDQDHQIWSSLTAHTPDGEVVDLSTGIVEYAFPASGERPAPSDWKTGAWVSGYPSYDLTPADIPLTVGLWDVWLRITIGTVVIEVRVDQIVVY